jgi:hypothetical protein
MQSNVYHARWKNKFKHKGFSTSQDVTSIQDWTKSMECPLFTPHSKANLHSSHVMITMNKQKRMMYPKIPTTKCSNCDTFTHIANDNTNLFLCNCDVYISLKYWCPFWIVVLCVNKNTFISSYENYYSYIVWLNVVLIIECVHHLL